MIYFFSSKKTSSIALEICPLIEDCVYSVIADFKEIWLKSWHCIRFSLVFTFPVFSSYYKKLFNHLEENRSKQPFMLEQNQKEFWNHWNIPKKQITNKGDKEKMFVVKNTLVWHMSDLLYEWTFVNMYAISFTLNLLKTYHKT